MRAKIDGIEVEGSPDEILALIRAHRGSPVASKVVVGEVEAVEEIRDERFASEKIAYRALRRRPLSAAQSALFRILADAYPDWVPVSHIREAIGHSGNQLGGLLGGIGRRLSTTDGYERNTSLIEWTWSDDDGEYSYRLPPAVYAAFRRIDQ